MSLLIYIHIIYCVQPYYWVIDDVFYEPKEVDAAAIDREYH